LKRSWKRGNDFGVGKRAFRIDVREKVLGYGEYPDDVVIEDMVHVSAVRSKYPRAKVLEICAEKALALPGVLAVLTAEDVPNNKVGHIQQDWDVMIAKGDITRCVGDAICLVIAETESILEKAKKLVQIDYEKLEPIRNVHEAKKVKFSRQESLHFHPKRHAMEGTFTLGCDENGIFTGLDCDIYFDMGAYASLCGPVLERACTHSVGPYCYQNTDIRGYGYYTNNPSASAFRGFGVCQSQFALESNINLLAEMVGISPWEIRYRNAIEPGEALPNGQIADCSTALKETLEAVKDVYEQNIGRECSISLFFKNKYLNMM